MVRQDKLKTVWRQEMSKTANGANLGFENKLWEMADKMRGHMDAAEYKHVSRFDLPQIHIRCFSGQV